MSPLPWRFIDGKHADFITDDDVRKVASLIFRAFAMRSHLYDTRFKSAEGFNQVRLRSHHLVNILVYHRHFIQTCRHQGDFLFFQLLIYRAPFKGLHRALSTHHATGTMGGRMQRFGRPLAPHEKARRSHRARNDT